MMGGIVPAFLIMLDLNGKTHNLRLFILAIFFIAGVISSVWLSLHDEGILQKKPWIAYIGHPLEQPEIWRVSSDGSRREQLTETGGNIIDFSVSKDGKTLAYSQVNQSGGSDIWIIYSNGKREQRLVDCGADICSQPAWSPDKKLIAYSRIGNSSNISNEVSPQHIWTVNVKSGRTGQLFTQAEITGKSPVFSPDGNQLAFYDTSQHAIHLFNLITGKSEFIPTQVEDVGSFSPDSDEMVFTDVDAELLPPAQVLYMVDLEQKNVTSLLGKGSPIIDASDPIWSPHTSQIVFSALSSQIPGKQLWVINKDGSGLQSLTDDPTAVHAAASWSPDGTRLIFQTLELGSSKNRPEIKLLDFTSRQSSVIADDAAIPAWLP